MREVKFVLCKKVDMFYGVNPSTFARHTKAKTYQSHAFAEHGVAENILIILIKIQNSQKIGTSLLGGLSISITKYNVHIVGFN